MKWAIREAVDVYFKAKSVFKLGSRTIREGEPILIFDTVKTGTIEGAAETSFISGGRGNIKLIGFDGEKSLSFKFEDALLSAEGISILAGADLIPARNKRLPGSATEARSIVSHFTEKCAVSVFNIVDTKASNVFPVDPAIGGKPQGGYGNIYFTRKPYVGQNASIYVMLLDKAGELSGSPLEINLKNKKNSEADNKAGFAFLHTFEKENEFVAFDKADKPMKVADYADPTNEKENAVFDDRVKHYVDFASALAHWAPAWGDINDYKRTIGDETNSGSWAAGEYRYLLAAPGGVAQPKAYKIGAQIVYKASVPSILYQDIVLLDYYVESKHDATQITILPDKFAPYVYVEGSSLVKRASDGMDLPCEFVIPKLKIKTMLNISMSATGDPSPMSFEGEAFPDFSKFDLTRKVLADIQILDADDNYDGAAGNKDLADPTSYRRFKYDEDSEGSYIWKDQSLVSHRNIDYSDTGDYVENHGGPATKTPGIGVIDNE